MKVCAVIQARMSSQRLPGKVLTSIAGRPALDWVYEAVKASNVDEVVVACSDNPADEPIVEWCLAKGAKCVRGPEDDVLSRYMTVAAQTDADVFVRITGDCVFTDPALIDQVVKLLSMKGVMYASNTEPPTFADGNDVEAFTREALEQTNREASRPSDRECVTRFMVRNQHRMPSATITCPLPNQHKERFVLDSPEDLKLIVEIASRLSNSTPPSFLQILNILDKEPWLRDINKHLTRNERFLASRSVEMDKPSYAISKACLARAEHLIPLGAQTFSKSKLQFPEGVAPLFVTHGDGGIVYDVDGREYIDLVSGLLPNILGYRDPDVDTAIREQLDRGISFSLATTLETDLAERLNYHIPSAEMVRYGKNGSDVTTAAIRLARHITGRDKIMVGGYHGWHDWSMATSERTNGIPEGVKALSYKPATQSHYKRPWGDMRDVAAIIVEPEFYTSHQLKNIRHTADADGVILIFDEIISGFRCGMGGLQKVTNVTPDLSTFGKAMANGMPLSALVGREQFMKRMPEISYSGTFFGETLSIAASIATIDKLHRLNVPGYLNQIGAYLRGEVNVLLEKHSVSSIQLYGEVELNRIKFSDKTIQSLFIQEMAKNGVLIIGSMNTCWAHKKPELDRILTAWDNTLKAIAGGAKLEGGIIQGKAIR